MTNLVNVQHEHDTIALSDPELGDILDGFDDRAVAHSVPHLWAPLNRKDRQHCSDAICLQSVSCRLCISLRPEPNLTAPGSEYLHKGDA